jgi:hypothetical protein
MDPYLEHPDFWSEVHHWLITVLAESLNPQVLPKYRVAIEKRVYRIIDSESLLVGIPDVSVQQQLSSRSSTGLDVAVTSPAHQPVTVMVPMPQEVRESYLEVRDLQSAEVVTVIELLSPKNKRPGEGRQVYEKKRQQILASLTHLVEIDLLRGGEPIPIWGSSIQSHYRILVSRSDRRPQADLYTFNLGDPIPLVPLPLRSPDKEPVIDLQRALDTVYDRAGYNFAIDYSRKIMPPLSEAETAWVENLLHQKG